MQECLSLAKEYTKEDTVGYYFEARPSKKFNENNQYGGKMCQNLCRGGWRPDDGRVADPDISEELLNYDYVQRVTTLEDSFRADDDIMTQPEYHLRMFKDDSTDPNAMATSELPKIPTTKERVLGILTNPIRQVKKALADDGRVADPDISKALLDFDDYVQRVTTTAIDSNDLCGSNGTATNIADRTAGDYLPYGVTKR